MFLYDFIVFYNAGLAVLAGRSPYTVPDFVGPYFQAMLFAPLSLLPLPAAYGLYLALTLYLLWRLLRKRSIWALLAFPVLFSLFVGQLDLPLALGIGAVPWLLPLALLKPQVGLVLAPWLLRRYSKADWLKAIPLGIGLMAGAFILRPEWVSEWMAGGTTFTAYAQHASNLYYLVPGEWIDLRVGLTYGLSILAFIAGFFIQERKLSWTAVSLFAPLSNIYSPAVLAEWIGPWEAGASYLALALTGGVIHEGMPMYLVGVVIIGRHFWPEIREKIGKRIPPTPLRSGVRGDSENIGIERNAPGAEDGH
jgi:hypothetical protein